MLQQWLTRPSNLLNRATGLNYTAFGTAPTNILGPDTKSYGLSFLAGAFYSAPDVAKTILSLCFWAKAATTNGNLFDLTGADTAHTMQIIPNGSATFIYVGTNGHSFATGSLLTSNWVNVWVTYDGTTLTVYANGVLVQAVAGYAGAAMGGTNFLVNSGTQAASVYDVRLFNTLIAPAAIAYYYDQVLNNTGVKVLPQV